MKNLLPFIMLAAVPVTTIATNNVTFPVNHVKVAANASYSMPLVGPGLMRDGWPYTITCQLTNPANQNLNVYINGLWGYSGQTTFKLNGQDTNEFLHLKPGANTLVAPQSIGNVLNFFNYNDNDAFIIENCTAIMD